MKLQFIDNHVSDLDSLNNHVSDLDSLIIIIPQDAAEFMLESIYVLGYDEENILRLGDEAVRVETLLVPSVRKTSENSIYSYNAYDWLRNQILSNVESNDNSYEKKVYISREDADDRRIKNREQLLSNLDEVEKIVASRLTLEEQVNIFSDAKVIMGPHGGGFTNIIFGNDTTVIEFYGDLISQHYFQMSFLMDFDYACKNIKQSGNDLHCDIDDCVKFINNVVG